MSLDDISTADSVAQRDRERAVEARWFIVAQTGDGVLMVDRKTLEKRGPVRTGWTMAFKFADGKVSIRATARQRWNCTTRTNTVLTIQTYNSAGTPDPPYTAPGRAEAVVPETTGEDALNFVCGRPIESRPMPMPVNRDPISSAEILAAYAGGSEITVLGMLLATLDPLTDRERLRSLLELEPAEKRARLSQLIWKGFP